MCNVKLHSVTIKYLRGVIQMRLPDSQYDNVGSH